MELEAYTLSMTVSDVTIARNPTAAKATAATNPDKPMPQNIVTEKYLEKVYG